jgi:hypothetical protein
MVASLSEIVGELSSLSPEQIGQVRDFVLALKSQAGQTVEQSDEWTDEDLRDVMYASLSYAEATLSLEELSDDESG